MKKSVIDVVFSLVLLMSFVVSVSAFSANSYHFTEDFECEDFGIECGTASILHNEYVLNNEDESDNSLYYVTEKSCGICSPDKYCYNGKCIDIDALGVCERSLPITDCNSFYFSQSLAKTEHNAACIANGCDYDSTTDRCTGILPSCPDLMERKCLEVGAGTPLESRSSFNKETGLCNDSVNSFLICADKTWLWGTECQYSNIKQYEPQVYILYKNVPSTIIYLSTEDLESIKAGDSTPIFIKLVNSGLPEGASVRFNIIDPSAIEFDENGVVILGSGVFSTLNGITDADGKVNAEWLLSNKELSKIDFEGGRDVGYIIQTFVGETPVNAEVYRDPLISIHDAAVNLKFKTKTGECLEGVSTCEDYDNWYLCHEAKSNGYDCTWQGDYESGSCVGGNAMSCDYSRNIKNICIALGCKWKANSIFERFFDWIKSIFSR